MAVTYTTRLSLGKPTIGDSYNVWGTELNTVFDLLDESIISSNFAENSTNHSGLNFAYKAGRILDGTTQRTVTANTIALTDNATNYIECSIAGVISANTTSFTDGKIPLFTALTVGGVITTVTDKRAYFSASYTSLFTLPTNLVIETLKNLKVGAGTVGNWMTNENHIQLGGNSALLFSGTEGANSRVFLCNNAIRDVTDSRWEYISNDEASILGLEAGGAIFYTATTGVVGDGIGFNESFKVDVNRNFMLGGAAAESDAQGCFTLSAIADPTTNSNGQITLFSTNEASSTLGLQAEEVISEDTFRVKLNLADRYLHMRETALNPLSSFITSTLTIANDVTETTVISLTVPGRAAPAGQMLHIQLHGLISTNTAAHRCDVKLYVGADTTTIYNSTSAALTNSAFWINFYVYVKTTTAYCSAVRASFGGNTWNGSTDTTEDFTSDVLVKVTSTWTDAHAATTVSYHAGVIKVYN